MPPSPTVAGHWRRHGWALVAGFLGDVDLARLRLEAERLWARPELFAQRGAVVQSPTRRDRLDPVIDLSAPFDAMAGDSRLVGIASQLLGGNAQLMKDKFIAKPPGTSGYTAHQDGAYWQGMGLDLDRVLTAVLFLDDSPAERGAIECAPNPGRLLTDPGVVADVDESAAGLFQAIEAEAGDLLLLHAMVPHRSGPNKSDDMRRTLLFTYGVDPRPDLYAIYHQAVRA